MMGEVIEINEFLNNLTGDYSHKERSLIEKACHFSEEAHRGQKRASGEPYFHHCLKVASLLDELQMGYLTVCSGLLHDIIEDTAVNNNLLSGEFPEPIPHLVNGVTKISTINFRSAREKQAENLRRMILAMARDIRVVIIKLCDRLHNMRTLEYLPPPKQTRIARDTLDIYAPLATRLGMMRIRGELEDLSMKYLYPEEYEEIAEKIERRNPMRKSLIERHKAILENKLKERGIEAKIMGRSKNIYNIFRKMRRQNIKFEEIYDLTAIRIITNSLENCYDILGLIHSLWRPIPGRMRDFIALPKENQYQSLHTSVMGLEGEALEIQIRTWEMHRIAEEGIAAHWKYKEGKKGEDDIDKRLKWLRQIIEWLKDIQNPEEFMDALEKDVFSDIVFCFTPHGDVVQLPRGSTPLDFAYHIHTEVGHTCIGARVNKKYVALKTTLGNGDMVEIITSKNSHPSRDWLDIVKTSRARSKIKHYLKTQAFDQYMKMGRDLLQRALKAHNLTLSSEEVTKQMEEVVRSSRANTQEELFFEIGFGSLLPQDVAQRFVKKKQAPKKKKKEKEKSGGIIIHGMSDAYARYAQCCKPIPGDPIVGFITRGRGISIHKKDCPSIKRMMNNNHGDHSRFIPAQWDKKNLPTSKVSIRVIGRDRTGLLNDVTGCIREMELNVEELHSKLISNRNQAVFRFQVTIDNTTQLNELLNRIKNVPGVLSISRTVRTR